jgi:peptidoglycan/LPS O-acetylase OafA/YrhL
MSESGIQIDKQESGRIASLDVLRAIAVLLVLGRHLPLPGPDIAVLPARTATRWVLFGWVGVDLFFVLSGFLVGGLLFAEYRARGAVRVGRFFVRRAFKIYPAFYVFLAFLIIWGVFQEFAGVAPWVDVKPLSWRNLLGETLFLQNYVGQLQGHTWSLAVEEHFYVLLGTAWRF